VFKKLSSKTVRINDSQSSKLLRIIRNCY